MKNSTFFKKQFLVLIAIQCNWLLINANINPPLNSICFQENKGQIHDQNGNSRNDIFFTAANKNNSFHFRNNGVSFQLSKVDTWKEQLDYKRKEIKKFPDQITYYRIDIYWIGSNKNTKILGEEVLPFYNNYFQSNNSSTHVKSFNKVKYLNLYDGIDLHYYLKNNQIKYDFVVKPFFDYHDIQFEINGAEKIVINKDGSLTLKTPLGDITEEAPLVYQDTVQIKSKWVIKNNILSFEIGKFDPGKTIIIDPLIKTWGTYFGGPSDECGNAICNDNQGNVITTGYTWSTSNVATSGSHQTTYGGGSSDCLLMKFDNIGNLLWGTYYGGSFFDSGQSCEADSIGNIYIAGQTNSPDGISTPGCHEPSLTFVNGAAFLAKFSPTGNLIWGTYYNNNSNNGGINYCALDNLDYPYLVTGASIYSGTTMVTPAAHQTTINGISDALIVKFNGNGSRIWGTYFGGNGADGAFNCSADRVGNIYVTGYTASSSSLSTPGCHQSSLNSSSGPEGFLAKFTSNGTLRWATYYGGDGNIDEINSVSNDINCNVIIAGRTNSSIGNSIASTGCHQPTFAGNVDAFVAKFDSTGTRLWGTYYGGENTDGGYACPTDLAGNIFLAGEARTVIANTAIATFGTYEFNHNGGFSDGFLVKLTPNGIRHWGTYIGGNELDYIDACSTDGNGNLFVTAWTLSPNNIASSGCYQSTNCNGSADGFILSLNYCSVTPTLSVVSTHSIICKGEEVTLTASCANFYAWGSNKFGNSIVVSPSVTTTYTLTGQDTIGCPSKITFTQMVSECTNIKEKTTANELQLFPNPTSGVVIVKHSSSIDNYTINIYNSIGDLIYKQQTSNSETKLDLSMFKNGLYFVKIIDNNNNSKIVKLLKQ